jgi:hypothetical protein
MVYNTTQTPPPPPPPTATHCYTVRLLWEGGWGGGEAEVREKVKGQQFTSGVENTNMTDCVSNL